MLEQVLVGNAPDIGETGVVYSKSVAHIKTIAGIKRLHVVKLAVASIKKTGVIPVFPHDFTPG